MSDGAYVDPVKLRHFADELSRTLAEYGNALEKLDSRLSRLAASWRDQEFEKFSREVKNSRRVIEEFIREGQKAKQNLLRDADEAEAYQRVSGG